MTSKRKTAYQQTTPSAPTAPEGVNDEVNESTVTASDEPVTEPAQVPVTPMVPRIPTPAEVNLLPQVTRLNEYLAQMAPGRTVSDKEGIANQERLYHILVMGLLEKDEEIASETANEFLRLIAENIDGTFGGSHACRWFDQLHGLTSSQRMEFECILSILTTVAVPETRKVMLRRINWDAVSEQLQARNSDTIRRRLMTSLHLE